MTFRLVRAVAQIERSDDWHLARILILLHVASGKKGTRPIEGIMKLAKMDFLLRYPNCLERMLHALDIDPEEAHIQDFEKDNVEAKMIRFRYGPWDDRYRKWIGLLVARGLVQTYTKGKTIHVGLTDQGHPTAERLMQMEEFHDLAERSKLVQTAVGKMSATRLKEFVYETFPELLDMRWGEEIQL